MMPAVLRSLRHVVDPTSKPVRLEKIGEVVLRELSPELREDFLRFFDDDAFADNPYWAECYCTAHHRTNKDMRTPAENRTMADELVRCGRMQGFLAYVDGRPAAWCNAARRPTLAGLALDAKLAVDDAEQVGSVVCFIVAAPYRRHGLARALLDAAVTRFRDQGLSYAEAYPSRGRRFGGPGGDSDLCRGPLELYLGAGFEVYRDLGDRLIVRKAVR
jgi:GNAT superfamily N-acetyltransferase